MPDTEQGGRSQAGSALSPLIRFSIALHLLALVLILVRPADWPWALGAVIADHLLIASLGLWPRSTWLGPNMNRLPRASAARNEVALTIDDGPHPEVTPAVLDLLDRFEVKATFFCIGDRANRYPELCREIRRRGHAVENHSQRHRLTFALWGPRACLREVQAAQDTLRRITGETPLFFRAPAGFRNPFLEPALRRLGLRLASWTRRGFDTQNRSPERVVRMLLRNLRSGDILLLHDGNAARTASGRPVILEVLPELLPVIRAAGLQPVLLRSALV